MPVCGRWCGPRPEGFWFPLLPTNLPSFPNDAGEHPLNITQGFPWRQGSELAMVMVMNLEWVVSSLLKYPLQNFIFVAGLLYVPLSHLFYLLLLHSNLLKCLMLTIILWMMSEPLFQLVSELIPNSTWVLLWLWAVFPTSEATQGPWFPLSILAWKSSEVWGILK